MQLRFAVYILGLQDCRGGLRFAVAVAVAVGGLNFVITGLQLLGCGWQSLLQSLLAV
ncbi:hypothetical protein [Paenibacillus alba]|uniref:Uncharacterized protein n=1 Tax=Paenibacillus alba TaxID=1197127 RepID=A0ABU6FZN9_9BACL|nr:hypothetical protein [Paenibacillus alba]MEC0227372.1 hypothetical protein [Paenibacillus alba]